MGQHSDLSQHTTPNNSNSHPPQQHDNIQSGHQSPQKQRLKSLLLLSIAIIALLISLVAGYTTFKMHNDQRQLILLQSKMSQLNQQIGQLKNGLAQSSQQVDKNIDNNQQLSLQLKQQITQQNGFSNTIQQLQNQLEQQNNQLQQLQQQQLTSTQYGAPQQRLLQAEQLLQQATMQIWVYQTPTQATPLLNEALQLLDNLHLPVLQPIIDAINSELQELQSTSKSSLADHYTQLQHLMDQVTQLHIATPTQQQATTNVTHSIDDWKSNLLNSLKQFSRDFIQIAPRDPLAYCLQTATSTEQAQHCQLFRAISSSQQQQNLFDNLRDQLMIATLALITHQTALFNSALNNAINWTQQYFDITQPNTQQFLAKLQSLQQTKLFPDLPYPLPSSKKLAKLLDDQLIHTSSPVTVPAGR